MSRRRAAPICLILSLAFVGAGLVSGRAVAAESKVALVIGNSGYKLLQPLRNPSNDATDVSASLKTRGFDVTVGVDLDEQAFKDAVSRFAEKARQADVALFYYAGHGFQVSSRNYLVPVDAVINKREDVDQHTVDLNAILSQLRGGNGVRLIFLDACRNNPLKSEDDPATANLSNGLARIGDAAGFLIAYATQPDNVAFDGRGRNSPFAQAVLSHIATRGQDIGAMMISVRKDVLAVTGGQQVPWENSSLTRQFFFTPGIAAAASPETQLWQLAATDQNPSLLRIYIERYPEGAHANEARGLIKGTQVASLDAGSVRSTPSMDTGADDRLWELAQRSRMRALVDFYLSRNPQGRHVPEARQLLDALTAAETDAPPEMICEKAATHPRDATANTAGVPLAELAKNAGVAIQACQEARKKSPQLPQYTALLARAMVAAGRKDEAVRLYREAADAGNLRAMVSLGLITEAGDGVPRDPKGAFSLYERAAAGGLPDGAINLAVQLIEGNVVTKNVGRAVKLLKGAADAGSAIASYNLGVLAQDGMTGNKEMSIALFRKATELGDPRGFVPAAIILDEGRGIPKNPIAASEMLLQGVAADTGEAANQIVQRSTAWSPDTIRQVQMQLKKAGYYKGPLDGRGGPKLAPSLEQWRRYGTLESTRSLQPAE